MAKKVSEESNAVRRHSSIRSLVTKLISKLISATSLHQESSDVASVVEEESLASLNARCAANARSRKSLGSVDTRGCRWKDASIGCA